MNWTLNWMMEESTHLELNGEQHAWSPSTISNLQKAVRINSQESFKQFSIKLMVLTNQHLL